MSRIIQRGECLLGGGVMLPGRACSMGWGACCQGEVIAPGGGCGDPPHDGYCCGWYASYWNAFLYCRCKSWCNAENQAEPAPSVQDCLRDCEWVSSLFPQLLQIFQIFKGTVGVVKNISLNNIQEHQWILTNVTVSKVSD